MDKFLDIFLSSAKKYDHCVHKTIFDSFQEQIYRNFFYDSHIAIQA